MSNDRVITSEATFLFTGRGGDCVCGRDLNRNAFINSNQETGSYLSNCIHGQLNSQKTEEEELISSETSLLFVSFLSAWINNHETIILKSCMPVTHHASS